MFKETEQQAVIAVQMIKSILTDVYETHEFWEAIKVVAKHCRSSIHSSALQVSGLADIIRLISSPSFHA